MATGGGAWAGHRLESPSIVIAGNTGATASEFPPMATDGRQLQATASKFPIHRLWGVYGASCMEQERNLIVAKYGTYDKDVLKREMKSLFDRRIAPALFVD